MSTIRIRKPEHRWLFGGVGFHNSEATMTALMTEEFRNQHALKTFREISPTYSRVFAGYADWTKEAMDAFADYYDETFRRAGTVLYLVPGRMPYITEDFDKEAYCEKVAANLEYLIRERNCTKIRYYCVTNELSVGNTYAYLASRPELLKELHECLYRAFQRHGLDVGLLATDCSGAENFHQIRWAAENMDEVTECYCAHLYNSTYAPGDLRAYAYYMKSFTEPVMIAHGKEKRFVLGEYGITAPGRFNKAPMRNDVSWGVDFPEVEDRWAIGLCEMAIAAINSGCLAAVSWTMLDYPDPLLREDGDTPEEKARYDAVRFSGHGLSIRYNKNGMIRWCDDERDFTPRASLYTVGYMAKLFRKGSRVLECEWEDESLRCAAVTNADGSVSVAIINWSNEAQTCTVSLEHTVSKPLRKYVFAEGRKPQNPCGDLPAHTDTVEVNNNRFETELPPCSAVFLTSDYAERTPSAVRNVRVENGYLLWDPCEDAEHCYYRVYAASGQIASTVACRLAVEEDGRTYKVVSVDTSGNVGR